MSKQNKEYELFKSICQSQAIEAGQNDIPLIKNLQNKGMQIIKTKQGYCLDDHINILCEKKIRSALAFGINELIAQLDVIFETPSTNQAITAHKTQDLYSVLVSEFQSEGQGRRAKKWISPLGCNIYLSVKFQLTLSENTQFLPLITALSVCKALARVGIEGCKIKWPNDIYLNGKKVGGILAENRYSLQSGHVFIIGIGLNVNMQANEKIDQSWTSLRNSQNKVFDRNIILSALLSETLGNYNQLSRFTIQQFKKEWSVLDFLHGQTIQVTDEKNSYQAIALGIADDGALVIERDNVQEKIYSAEVSVKSVAKLCNTEEGQK